MTGWRRRVLVGALLGGGALLAWLAAPVLLRRISFFDVRRVELVGVDAATPAELVAAMRIAPGASLFDDLGPYRARVLALPGIRRAEVHRRLPGTLVVEVTEAQAVALSPRKGRLALVGRTGKFLPFDPAVSAPDLPVIATPGPRVAKVLGRLQEIDPELFSRVLTASEAGGDVVVDLGGRRIWLRPDVTAEVIRAVTAAEAVLGQQGRAWTELDGRFGGQVVVRGRGRPS
ncbi:MAG TPA: FtsQ-type POTRA domain-containing protein [Gemmatimonadales bacterium]|nr:FtsQ-type POTRA domain-containing protein [Gemmatimonadales bacterium]